MRGIIFDAGALIALERNDRKMWAVVKAASRLYVPLVVPSTVLAQVWRGTRRPALLGRALADCVVAPFDALARAVGELCGGGRTRDICDAHVALVATTRGDVLYTGDPDDLARLIAVCQGPAPTIISC